MALINNLTDAIQWSVIKWKYYSWRGYRENVTNAYPALDDVAFNCGLCELYHSYNDCFDCPLREIDGSDAGCGRGSNYHAWNIYETAANAKLVLAEIIQIATEHGIDISKETLDKVIKDNI